MSNRWNTKIFSTLLVLSVAACSGDDDDNGGTDGNAPATNGNSCQLQCTTTTFTPACEVGTGALEDYNCSANLQSGESYCEGTVVYAEQHSYHCQWTTLATVLQTATCDGAGTCTNPEL